MFFSLREILSFLGISVFEIWLNVISLTIFTILLAFKLDGLVYFKELNWWSIFLPLFIADGLNCYFCIIVFIRMYLCGQIKNGLLCTTWSLSVLTLIFVFKFLLCRKLSGQSTLEYSEVVSPIFILLQLFVARACQMH